MCLFVSISFSKRGGVAIRSVKSFVTRTNWRWPYLQYWPWSSLWKLKSLIKQKERERETNCRFVLYGYMLMDSNGLIQIHIYTVCWIGHTCVLCVHVHTNNMQIKIGKICIFNEFILHISFVLFHLKAELMETIGNKFFPAKWCFFVTLLYHPSSLAPSFSLPLARSLSIIRPSALAAFYTHSSYNVVIFKQH